MVILGGDDDDLDLGLGPLGDTLNIEETIARQADFTALPDLFSNCVRAAGRDFKLRDTGAGNTLLDTDDSDDANLTLSTGVPANSLVSNVAADLGNLIAYDVVYIYSTAETEIGGSNDDPTDFDLSLAAGWNAVILESPDGAASKYSSSAPNVSLEWTYQTFS